MCWNSHLSIGITASIWTVIQTSFHIVWVICGYYFYVCKIKPSYYGLVIVYLTYFYKGECGNITLTCDGLLETDKETRKKFSLISTNEDEEELFDIVQAILDKGVWPAESSAAFRTHVYFHAFIVMDAAWIISAFLLFAGTCFQIKKCLSLIFYCPWLVVSGCVILLDVISSVHFGLDILAIRNFTSWLKFIGVQNYQDFTHYNSHSLSYIIPLIPALLLCTLFSRGLILWIWNIVLFVQVLNAAVLAFQDNVDGNAKQQPKRARVKGSDQQLNLDTSASRIRNWQLFYGAIGSTSSSSSKSSERDFNSNNTMRRTSTKVKIKDAQTFSSPPQTPDSSDSYEKYIVSITNESLRTKPPDASTYYHGYTDVAESFDRTLGRRINNEGPQKSQVPWPYYNPPDEKYDIEYSLNDSGDLDRYGLSVRPTASKTFISTEL